MKTKDKDLDKSMMKAGMGIYREGMTGYFNVIVVKNDSLKTIDKQ